MAHPYHHALSSVRKWGGAVEDYIPIHDFFDASKQIIADFRHRALRHHAEGIFMAETLFGSTLVLSNGRVIPVRWIGGQHIRRALSTLDTRKGCDMLDRIQSPRGILRNRMEAEYAAALEAADAGLVIAPHSVRFDPGELHGGLRRVRVLRQGDKCFEFL
jgi:hypothetical protein